MITNLWKMFVKQELRMLHNGTFVKPMSSGDLIKHQPLQTGQPQYYVYSGQNTNNIPPFRQVMTTAIPVYYAMS